MKKYYIFTVILFIAVLIVSFNLAKYAGRANYDETKPGEKSTQLAGERGPDIENPNEWQDVNLTIGQLRERAGTEPDFKTMWYLGKKLNAQKQHKEALDVFLKMKEKWPASAQVRLDISVVYNNLQQYDQAVKELREFLRLAPDHPGVPLVKEVIHQYEARGKQ